VSRFLHRWAYPHGDPSIRLFDVAVQRGWVDLPPSASVIELGCCETDFAKWMRRADPQMTLVGIDTRWDTSVQGYSLYMQADAASPDCSDPHTKDMVICLGSLEHFGLGYYGDPENPAADIATINNAFAWLKPGGLLYYDVPWTPRTPGHYITDNRHFRVYDDITLDSRIGGTDRWDEVGRFWAAGIHVIEPVWIRPSEPMVPFWYVARVLRKKVHR
jgi:SAM-dependent methyltransferase